MSSAKHPQGANMAPLPGRVRKKHPSAEEIADRTDEEGEEEVVTWKESSSVAHSSAHRRDKTAVAATEKTRLIRIPT